MVNGVNERRAARPRISTGRMIFSDCPHKRADTYHDARSGTRGSIIQGLQYHRWRLILGHALKKAVICCDTCCEAHNKPTPDQWHEKMHGHCQCLYEAP